MAAATVQQNTASHFAGEAQEMQVAALLVTSQTDRAESQWTLQLCEAHWNQQACVFHQCWLTASRVDLALSCMCRLPGRVGSKVNKALLALETSSEPNDWNSSHDLSQLLLPAEGRHQLASVPGVRRVIWSFLFSPSLQGCSHSATLNLPVAAPGGSRGLCFWLHVTPFSHQ